MPVHDGTRVPAGTFHDFHSAWIIHLKETLNGGLLPEGYYALAEQHAGLRIADFLTLQAPGRLENLRRPEGGLALAQAPPRIQRKMVAEPRAAYRMLRRTLTIRHISGHRIVALLEIVSPGNKDRAASVAEIVDKVDTALRFAIHVLVVDLFPPGPHDPSGIHGAIWACYSSEDLQPPAGQPLTLASYVANPLPEAYVEYLAVGDSLPEMPLFLDFGSYVNIPLESTYQAAHRGMPAYWRDVLEGLHTQDPS